MKKSGKKDVEIIPIEKREELKILYPDYIKERQGNSNEQHHIKNDQKANND